MCHRDTDGDGVGSGSYTMQQAYLIDKNLTTFTTQCVPLAILHVGAMAGHWG
jgi:hypothetical protein